MNLINLINNSFPLINSKKLTISNKYSIYESKFFNFTGLVISIFSERNSDCFIISTNGFYWNSIPNEPLD